MVWSNLIQETGYNSSNSAMVANHLLVAEVMDMWSTPTQETGFNPSRSAVVMNYPTTVKVMDVAWDKPAEETGYITSKSAMVMNNPLAELMDLWYTCKPKLDTIQASLPLLWLAQDTYTLASSLL